MKSPFPGMDPYLESHWGDVHTSLTTYASDQLSPQLPSDLRVRIEEYVEENGRPPGALEPPTLRYLKIIDVRSGNRLVTAIEFLSPANKKGKAGRAAYRKKQRKFMAGGVNLVEIDLLRAGQYVLVVPQGHVPARFLRPYRVCVFRASRSESAEVYRVSLRERLPGIRIPLRDSDADVALDLQQLIERSYELGRYDDIDYRAEPLPPLSATDARWADELLREKAVR